MPMKDEDIDKKRIIYLISHPIQYYAPLFKAIEETGRFDLEVWYCSKYGLAGEIDKEFKTSVKWDIPILEGYKYIFLKNFLRKANAYTFFGLFSVELIFKLYRAPKSLVIVPGWKYFSYILAFFLGKLFGHKIAIRAESPLNQELLKGEKALKVRHFIFKNFLFKNIDYYLYLGKQSKAFYKYYGIKNQALFFTPYAVDNARFLSIAQRLKGTEDSLRNKHGIPLDKVCFLYSGKYITKKRPLDLLRAFYQIPNNKDAYLIFMGEGELRSEIESFINQFRLDNVKLTGFVNQSKVVEYYAASDVFVMCSQEGETWGLSTNEAMNFGLPLIISDMTGCSLDLVKENENGYTFPLGDVQILSEKMKFFIEMGEEQRKKMGIKSKNIVQSYSYETIIKGLEEVKL